MGAALGGGSTIIGDKVGSKLRHKLNQTNSYKKNNLNVINELDLAEGKISEKEYIKNKKKINKK